MFLTFKITKDFSTDVIQVLDKAFPAYMQYAIPSYHTKIKVFAALFDAELDDFIMLTIKGDDLSAPDKITLEYIPK